MVYKYNFLDVYEIGCFAFLVAPQTSIYHIQCLNVLYDGFHLRDVC